MKKIIATLLCAVMLFAAFSVLAVFNTSAAVESCIPEITGETGRNSKNIKLSDGTDTGVTYTMMKLSGKYGTKLANFVEFDLSNTHLSVNAINCGDSLIKKATVANAASAYSTDGKTVLAAMNGDLWLTAVHTNSDVTKSSLGVSRGIMIIDREIWATEQFGMENYCATNAEKGTTSPIKSAFGVTSKNQPLVGSIEIKTTIKNTTSGTTAVADGINRLPAWNSLVVYNYRVNSSNYALDDSYEIELEVDNPSFVLGETVSATVKKIYASGSATRPGLGSKNIVLTARGDKMSLLNTYKVGDKIEISTQINDRYGKTELWEDVVDAIGGHMTAIRDGAMDQSIGGSEYPASIIGFNDDGKVIFCTITAPLADDGSYQKKYQGLNLSQTYEFCKEIGYNSVFVLDGGGSATFVTLEKGTYTVRNNCNDGAPRSVINAVAVCWNADPVCDKQGSLSYITTPIDKSGVNPRYIDGALMAELMTGENQVSISYNADNNSAMMTVNVDKANDPYASLNFVELMRVDAKDYPYVVFKTRTNYYGGTSQLGVFYAAGKVGGATAECMTSVNMPAEEDEWQYLIVDLSKASKWTGNINNMRLDMCNNLANIAEGTYYEFGAVVLCHDRDEAESVADGWIPDDDGVITDWLAYKESLKPVETTAEETTTVEETTEEETTAEETVAETSAEVTTAEDTTVAETTAADTTVEETTAAAKSGGCGSTVAAIAVIATFALASASLKKKKK